MADSRHLSPRHQSSDAPVTKKPKQTATCHLSLASPVYNTHTRAHCDYFFTGDKDKTVTSGGKPRFFRHCGVTGAAGAVTGEVFFGPSQMARPPRAVTGFISRPLAPNLSRLVRLPRALSVERASQLLGVSVVRLGQVFGCERPADLISARDLRRWVHANSSTLAYWQETYRACAHGSPHRLPRLPA